MPSGSRGSSGAVFLALGVEYLFLALKEVLHLHWFYLRSGAAAVREEYPTGEIVAAELATAQGMLRLGAAPHGLTSVEWVLAVKQHADPGGPLWKPHWQDPACAGTLLEAIRTTLCDSQLQGKRLCHSH